MEKIKSPWRSWGCHIFHQVLGGGGQMCSIGFCFQYSEQEAAKSKKIYKCIRHPCNKIDLLPFHCALSIIMFELQYSNIDCDQ